MRAFFFFILSGVLILLINNECFALPNEDNSVEIIDGGDVDTMKALFPSLKEEDLKGLKRMRDTRLEYEAKCDLVSSERFVSIVFSVVVDNAEFAGAEVKVGQEKIKKELSEIFFKVKKDYPNIEDILNRGKMMKGAEGYLVLVSKSLVVEAEEKKLKEFKDKFSSDYTIEIKKFKRCADGNILPINNGK